ncbi:MAG: FtsX-like permease family protein [Gemmatimonadota bacterium]
MRTLDLKVLRDAAHLKGQLFAVAGLAACGVAVFIMLRSMHGYLRDSQRAYYDDYGFGELFAHAVRAPESLEGRIGDIAGVGQVYTRIVRDVLVDVPGLAEPATGRLVSLPIDGGPALNRLHLRSGRLPEPNRRNQIVVSAAFAAANQLRPGDALGANISGRWEQLTIVGTAISPEFIYEISGLGSMFPDNRRFGAMWMGEDAMAAAFEMEGGFNDLVVDLREGASEAAVLAEVDESLEPYGGTGAYGRDLHLSHEFVTSEIEETQVTASFFPALFLIVTAFLLHTSMLRLVRMEREQIGLMKAFGFSGRSVASHYLKLALLPVAAGTAVGIVLGIRLAHGMASVYGRYYQFPELAFELAWAVVWFAVAIAFATGLTGALAAIRSVLRIAPAVAMAPPAPARFRHWRWEGSRLWRALTPAGRMIARNVVRSRWKSVSTAAGIALALGVLTALLSMFDAIDVIADLQFRQASRDDIAVFFEAPRSPDVMAELEHLPGVLMAEPVRISPARVTYEHRERRTSIIGLVPQGQLRRIVDTDYRVHQPPAHGVLVGRMMADKLGVGLGDSVRIEITEGHRPEESVVVAGLVEELMGGDVYMEAASLNRLLGEAQAVSGAWLRVDASAQDELYGRLKLLPGVSSVMVKEAVVRGFNETIQRSFTIALSTTFFLGAVLVVAIVYSQARIALSERGRDLASLRVLGFSRGEVARMLLGEQAVLVLLALPLGLTLGWALTLLVMIRFETELFRLPAVMLPETYLLAAGIVVASAALSAFLVRRRLDRIDLISVLKTRE